MSNIKKKLPTGPIRIDVPTPKQAETENNETRKQDSSLPENSQLVSREANIKNNDSEKLVEEAENNSTLLEFTKQHSSLIDSSLIDSSLVECKKVAMRLSAKGVDKLRQLRVETGIPYEILVDVMVCNWDLLPNRTQQGYLKQAKQLRAQRLMAGQEKTIKTMRKKFFLDP